MKTGTSSRTTGGLDPAATARRDERPAPRRRRPGRRWIAAALAFLAIAAAAGAYFGYQEYRESRLADSVRHSFAARRYDEARGPLQRWLDERPRSGEAQYYRAWLALVEQRPADAVDAIERRGSWASTARCWMSWWASTRPAPASSTRPSRSCGGPSTAGASRRPRSPGSSSASTCPPTGSTQAAEVVERYRELVPTDPEPYMWSNEIGSRSGATPAILIRNYRAALERDPDLDKARLGLAEQLSKDRRFDEASPGVSHLPAPQPQGRLGDRRPGP